MENSPAYVDAALEAGFEVAVDVLADDDGLWLVGRHARHPVGVDFLARDRVWVLGCAELPDAIAMCLNRMTHFNSGGTAAHDSLCVMCTSEDDDDDNSDIPGALARAASAAASSASVLTVCTDHAHPSCGSGAPAVTLRIALLHRGGASVIPFAALYAMSHPAHSICTISVDPDQDAEKDIHDQGLCIRYDVGRLNGNYDIICVERRTAGNHLPEFEHLLPPVGDPRPRVLVPSRHRSGGVNPELAIGTPASIQLYCSATCPPHMSQPQSLLWHLRAAGVMIEEFDFLPGG